MKRGATLLEVMIAGAVLLLGMVGIVQLLIAGMSQTGISNARAVGQEMAAAGLAQAMALPFDAVPAGVFDGGILFDGDGRRYGRTITVTNVGDGGVRARQVTVTTEWREILGAMSTVRTTQASVFITEIPDAGL